jgi:hypothetical protein
MTALERARNRPRLAYRALRVTRPRFRPAFRSARGNRAGRLVQSILQRYGGRQRHWPGLGLVFRRPQAGVLWRPVYHEERWTLSPRLSLAVLLPHAMTPRPSAAVPRQALGFEGQSAPVSLVTRLQPVILKSLAPPANPATAPPSRQVITERVLARQRVETTTSEELVRRMVDRGQRIAAAKPGQIRAEPVTTGGAAVAATRQPGRTGGAEPMPLILRRPARVAVEDGALPSPTRPRSPGANGSFAVPGQQALDLSQRELGRLTDQVVRIIDERMIAYRERTGRV